MPFRPVLSGPVRSLQAASASPFSGQRLVIKLYSDSGFHPQFNIVSFSTEITLAAGSHVSYAGAANILYYDSSTGVTYNLDAGWNKPYYVDPAQIPEHHSELGNGAAVLVPGLVAGVSTASEEFGLFPLSKLLQPALYFATRGFKLPSDLAEEMRKNYNQRGLLRTKEGMTFGLKRFVARGSSCSSLSERCT